MTKDTKHYDWFKILANNRAISQTHLQNLRRQFEQYGNITEVSPITVNKDGFIIDGQHRRILCEEFGYPVFYNEITPKNIELTPAINSNQKKWIPIDYVNFFAQYRPEYEALSRFMMANDITWNTARTVIFPNKSDAVVKDLTTGRLEVIDRLGEAQKRMNIIAEIGDIMGAKLTERYARGILRCLYMEDFDIERFMAKLKMVAKKDNAVRPRATNMADVLRNIEYIYNYHTSPTNMVLLFR